MFKYRHKLSVLRFGLLILAILTILISCSSKITKPEYSENPVHTFENAKTQSKEDQSGEFGLERKKFEAAMYLYEQAQTDLKSGASAKAISKLALAREYNPWHDDIKDLYVLATSKFVDITKSIDSTNSCDQINSRLTFLEEVAPDSLTKFNAEIQKCKFEYRKSVPKLNENRLATIKIPENVQGEVGQVDYSVIGEIDSIVNRNNYVPIRELLTLGLDYLSHFKIDIINPKPSQFSTDPNRFQFILPVKFKLEGGMDGSSYCSETEKLLGMAESTKYLQCKYWGYFLGNGERNYKANPAYFDAIWNKIWPLPQRVVVAFTFKYKNKPEKILRDVILTQFKPENVDMGCGFRFDFVSGELPLAQKDWHTIECQNPTVTLDVTRELMEGLIGISANFDLNATKDLYL